MNKNFIFLVLVLATTTTEVSPAERRTRTRPSQTTNPYATNPEHIAQQKQKRDERVANRAKQQAAREAAHNSSLLIQILELCFNGEFEQASILFADVTNINQQLSYTPGNTVLHQACHLYSLYGNDNLDQILTFLMKHGANPAQLNDEGQTALHVLCQNTLPDTMQPAVATLVAALGDSDNAQDIHGRTAVHYAAINDCAPEIFNEFSNIWGKDEDGLTPLDLSINLNQADAIRALIEHANFANSNGTPENVRTSFVRAVTRGNSLYLNTVINRLRQENPNIDINADNGPGANFLHYIAYLGTIDQMEIAIPMLIAEGININATIHSSTCLHGVAIQEMVADRILTARVLIKYGASPNIQHTESNKTPLHYAITNNHEELALELLNAPTIDISLRDNFLKTALHDAAYAGLHAVVHKLLDMGTDKDAVTNSNATALYAASAQGHISIVQLLLARGANASIQTNDGLQPIDVAANEEILQLLHAHMAAQAQ